MKKLIEFKKNETYDLLEFLEDKCTVQYWLEGKNISKGWVGFNCVYCDDKSNHLGIEISTGMVFCWKCGSHNFIKTILKLTDCTYEEAKKVVFSKKSRRFKQEKKRCSEKNFFLPKEIISKWPKKHLDYLKKRNFNPKLIIKKYNLKPVYTTGKYKFRIVIPIIMEKKIVSFICRDITGKQEPKYLMPQKQNSILTPKQCVYNYDSLTIGCNCILVEGPTDVWRMGDNSISFFGTKYTVDQILLIKKKKINTLFVLYDNDSPGKKSAIKVASVIAPLVQNIEIVSLQKHLDPGDLKPEEAEIIRRELGFN